MKFLEFIQNREDMLEDNVPLQLRDKILSKQIVKDLGFTVAETYFIYDNTNDINWHQVPAKCVFKPSRGYSSQAVIPTVATDDFRYNDLLRGRLLNSEQIQQIYNKHVADIKEPNIICKMVIEELFIPEKQIVDFDHVPIDYKFQMLYGNIGTILQINRYPKQHAHYVLYDGQWNVKFKNTNNPAIIPECKEQLEEMAKILSTHFPTPFISVDCYSTNKGAVFGEFTLTPGIMLSDNYSYVYKQEEDRLTELLQEAFNILEIVDNAHNSQDD